MIVEHRLKQGRVGAPRVLRSQGPRIPDPRISDPRIPGSQDPPRLITSVAFLPGEGDQTPFLQRVLTYFSRIHLDSQGHEKSGISPAGQDFFLVLAPETGQVPGRLLFGFWARPSLLK